MTDPYDVCVCGHIRDEHGYFTRSDAFLEDCSVPGCYCESFRERAQEYASLAPVVIPP
jgi:hypothetical protein